MEIFMLDEIKLKNNGYLMMFVFAIAVIWVDSIAVGQFNVGLFFVGISLLAYIVGKMLISARRDLHGELEFFKKVTWVDIFLILISCLILVNIVSGSFNFYSSSKFEEKVKYLNDYPKYYEIIDELSSVNEPYDYQQDINGFISLRDAMPNERIVDAVSYYEVYDKIVLADAYLVRLHNNLLVKLNGIENTPAGLNESFKVAITGYASNIERLSVKSYEGKSILFKFMGHVSFILKMLAVLGLLSSVFAVLRLFILKNKQVDKIA
jgi:hypothetical protein